MKTTIKSFGIALLGVGLFASGCAKKHSAEWKSLKNPEVVAQLKSFVAEKEAQAHAAVAAGSESAMPEYKPFFAAAEKGDWLALNNAFEDLKKRAPQYDHPPGTQVDQRLRGNQWAAVIETWGAFDAFGEGDEKYSAAFADDIIASIPQGSIYFGGTDPGRFLITAMQKSQVEGDPFFTLTQNALVDSTYLDYLRSMYGDKIYIPTAKDSQKCFLDYTGDAQLRLKENQLKPGENVTQDSGGRIQVSGQVAVMEINALLAKMIFDKNPDREFYIEESFPLDWMYPYLEPHGLIFKINRQPLPELSDEIVKKDHDYWTSYIQPMIGDWLNDDTSVEEISTFAEKVFVKKDFSGFKGDPRFIQNAYSHKMFSKLRSSIGGLYAWRAQQATGTSEKKRMNDEADFAFRQALALCPYSPEAVFRYTNLLLSQNRQTDALLVAETAAKMPAMQGRDGEQVRALVGQLKRTAK
ncbi:MAG TPA: hypothetical protein VIK59_02705 [Verrucomicrobiae bacterium]